MGRFREGLSVWVRISFRRKRKLFLCQSFFKAQH
jgi:hypothetical protein